MLSSLSLSSSWKIPNADNDHAKMFRTKLPQKTVISETTWGGGGAGVGCHARRNAPP